MFLGKRNLPAQEPSLNLLLLQKPRPKPDRIPKAKKAANVSARSLKDTKIRIISEFFAGVKRHFRELFLNAEQLVVFCHPV